MRRIALVTGGRADWTSYRPIARRIVADPALDLILVATGMHLARQFGHTADMLEADGFRVAERVDMLDASDTPEGIATSMGLGVRGMAEAYGRAKPDLVLVLGDRFEMHAAALAALPFKLPVAHVHGGEVTRGAIDDALRHSMTKLSHLHFVSTDDYARRVRQLGEEPWRVVVSGAPALDNLAEMPLLSGDELRARHGVTVDARTLLVTFHPVTLEYEDTAWQVGELIAALDEVDRPVVVTAPNADTSGSVIRGMLDQFVRARPHATLVENFGQRAYFSAMAHAAAMVGNSSSGIIEAPSFGLPVVNVGTRQEGRVRGDNVLDVGYRRDEIAKAIRTALAPEFRARLAKRENPYAGGGAAEIIVTRLRDVALDARLVTKRFIDRGEP